MTTKPSRQSALIETNVRWLRQALRLVGSLDDTSYTTTPRGLAPHRAGAHLRHILEFYQLFSGGPGVLPHRLRCAAARRHH